MGRKKNGREGSGKLLEAWVAPDGAGDPVGCVATSFTFTPSFFEEECLSRFLELETDPAEDGPLYIVEREEKLRQLECAAALVDQHHCKGSRSLRWDILPARPRQGLMHAKVSVLCWSNWVRLIVASANLTDDGYRRNQEVFGVLDYREGGEAPAAVLRAVLAFLRDAAATAERGAENVSPALVRWNNFLDLVWKKAGKWGLDGATHARQPVRVGAILVGPGRPQALQEIAGFWPQQAPPASAWVFSPFFDADSGVNRPAEELWRIMRQRGETAVTYCFEVEDVPGKEGKARVRAPESLVETRPQRESATASVARIILEANRPLHAKGIWLTDGTAFLYCVGSSNFTSAGLGLGDVGNFEANLCYVTRDDRAYKQMVQALPDYEELGRNVELQWQVKTDNDDEASGEMTLPSPFISAIFDRREGKPGSIILRFAAEPELPPGWAVTTEDQDAIYDERMWEAAGRPTEVVVPWPDTLPPAGLLVRWHDSPGAAWWPVNVASADALPPPEELKDLTLDALIDMLTSARPLHVTLREYLRRKTSDGGTENKPSDNELDPHKRVDTSGFLLQRTRRVSWALSGLRARLERPAASQASLDWRLYGPVGVMALASAIEREAKSEAEKAFLLAELALELGRVRPQEARGCLPGKVVRESLLAMVATLRGKARACATAEVSNLDAYIKAAFRKAVS